MLFNSADATRYYPLEKYQEILVRTVKCGSKWVKCKGSLLCCNSRLTCLILTKCLKFVVHNRYLVFTLNSSARIQGIFLQISQTTVVVHLICLKHEKDSQKLGYGPSINYVVSKSAIFDPLPPPLPLIVFFKLRSMW